jgi:hypothetical protein
VIPHDEVRHGFTLRDLDDCARIAVANAATRAGDYTDRYDAAWHAIAAHLMVVTDPPSRNDLIKAGRRAVHQEVANHLRHHGTPSNSEPGVVRPSFSRYWDDVVCHTASPETPVVESEALRRIWPHLTPAEQRAIHALADHGSYTAAAAALGVAYQTVACQLLSGRRRFLTLWHEGETPHLSAFSRNRKRVGRKTHCPQGHEYTDDNTRVYPRIVGGKRHTARLCKTCEQHRRRLRSAKEATRWDSPHTASPSPEPSSTASPSRAA